MYSLWVVIDAAFRYKVPENLKKPLENAINSVKESPEILEKMIINAKKLPEISSRDSQRITNKEKPYQTIDLLGQELDQQLKDFDKKVLTIKEFNMIDLAFDILFSLASFKTENFTFIEKVNNLDFKINPNEFDLLIVEINKHLKSLPEWNNYCIKIINQFEDLINLVNNVEESFFILEIQEKLLANMKELREKLRNKSKNLDEIESKRKKSFRPKQEDGAIYSEFIFIIGLKSVYDLIAELEYTTKKLKLLDSISIQKILGFTLTSKSAVISKIFSTSTPFKAS
ncbi:1764_t:CDS:2 [Gigaspora rosea]|nr:1764_t:CDS:2 [Gigaspora rosea]